MKYKSTRGSECVSVSEALLRGLASDGDCMFLKIFRGVFWIKNI